MRVRVTLTALAFSIFALPAAAVDPDETLTDPALETRAREISKTLRCVVCQSQSIDDSDAPLAKDLRLLVRERLKAGDTDKEAVDYIVARYGEYVLLRPRLNGRTFVLWAAPAALLLGAVAMGAQHMRKRPQPVNTPALTSEEEEKLRKLME